MFAETVRSSPVDAESPAVIVRSPAAELAPLGLVVHRHLRAGQVHAHLLRVASAA